MVRAAFERFFNDDPEIVVVGAVGTRDDFAASLAASQPHVVLLDPGLRRGLLPEMVKWLRRASWGARIVAMAVDHGEEMGALAAFAGADAFIDKEMSVDELRDAIKRVARR